MKRRRNQKKELALDTGEDPGSSHLEASSPTSCSHSPYDVSCVYGCRIRIHKEYMDKSFNGVFRYEWLLSKFHPILSSHSQQIGLLLERNRAIVLSLT